MPASKFAALEAQLLDATLAGDLLRVRARSRRRTPSGAAGRCAAPAAARAASPCAAPTRIGRRPFGDTTLPCRGAQIHRLLLNTEGAGLANALLDGGARTALHVAVERGNEAAVALLLAQCVARGRARAGPAARPRRAVADARSLSRASAPRSKADATALDADGKSAVEIALDRDAKGMLKLLTDPKAVKARMVDVQALMKREVQGNWAKSRRISFVGCVLQLLSACAGVVRAATG